MGSLVNCRKIVIVSIIIRFDLSDCIKGSFAIDTQMPIVFFFWGGGGENRYKRVEARFSELTSSSNSL